MLRRANLRCTPWFRVTAAMVYAQTLQLSETDHYGRSLWFQPSVSGRGAGSNRSCWPTFRQAGAGSMRCVRRLIEVRAF